MHCSRHALALFTVAVGGAVAVAVAVDVSVPSGAVAVAVAVAVERTVPCNGASAASASLVAVGAVNVTSGAVVDAVDVPATDGPR